MTPHEARPGVGTLKIDVRLAKFGRFNRATGTKDPGKAKEIVLTLRRLARERRYDLLGPMVQGLVTPLELHEAIWHGKLDQLTTPESIWPLQKIVERWLKTLDRSSRTVGDYGAALRRLGDATLGDLPELLRQARIAALQSGKRVAYNRLHTATSVMLRQTLGHQHALTTEVHDVERLREGRDRRLGNPLTLAEAHQLAEAMRAAGYGAHVGNLWSLCFSGMRADEYFSRRWRMVEGAVEILGTKSRDARRIVPLVYPLSQPSCSDDHFRHILHKLTTGERRPHDCRYTFVRWAENAGVPDLRLRWYAGHEVKSVTELYRRGRGLQEFLEADGEKLRQWFGEPPKMGLRLA